MATLISAATGNFTDAGTWKTASAVANAEVDSEASTRNVSTGNMDSTAFTLAATDVDAVAIKISSIITPTGTLTVTLRNSTAGTSAGSVTINASDLNAAAAGWHVFSFASHTPNGTDSYVVRLTRSVADGASNRISVFASSAADTAIARAVRLTTTGAPAAGDKLIVAGEFTGTGTSTTYTVTNDNTATTSFGPTVSGGPPQGMTVNDKATFSYGTSASTNYYLKLKGVCAVFPGGTMNIGTSGTAIPSTSTAVLEFDSAANVDSGLDVRGGTVNLYGATKTTTWTSLTADAAVAATVLTVGATSGWAASDDIGIASTTRTFSQCEKRTISTVDSATQVTISAGLTNAHSGTSPTQAEVVNLTRNVKVRGVSDSLQGYVRVRTNGTFTARYAEFSRLGSNTADKRGVDVQTTTGAFDMQFCALRDFIATGSRGLNVSGSTATNVTWSNNVSYNIQNSHFATAVTSGTWTADGNVMMLTSNAPVADLSDVGGTFTNNIMVGASTYGLRLTEAATVGTVSGNTVHSCDGGGMILTSIATGSTVSSTTVWRCNNFGIAFDNNALLGITLNGATLFGNATNNITTSGTSATYVGLRFVNVTANGDSTFATTNGFANSAPLLGCWFEGCDFGTSSGIKTGHSRDLNVGAASYWDVHLWNCKLSSSTELNGQSNLTAGSTIRSTKHDQTAGNHKAWFLYGVVATDTTTYKTASPGQTLTPNSASNKLESGSMRFALANGATATVTTYVNKSAAYNGAQPRLMLRRNPAAGITSDTVLATASGGTGSWLTLSGTTAAVTDDAVLEVFVDCDGTAGTVTVDDWSVA